MSQDEPQIQALLDSRGRTQVVYVAGLVGWLAEDDAVVDQVNAHLRGEQVSQEYWYQHSGEIAYSEPGAGDPVDCWLLSCGFEHGF